MNRKTLFLFAAFMLLATLASAQTVVRTTRLSNTVEAIVTIPKGPNTGLAVLDGRNVKLVRGFGRAHAEPTILFSALNIPIPLEPRGMGYSAENNSFVFTNNLDSTHLYITDAKGNLTSTIEVASPGDPTAQRVESVLWTSSTDPLFRNKFLVIVNDIDFGVPQIWVVSQTGQVEQTIDLSQVTDYATGFYYESGSRFIVANANDDAVSVTDLAGNPLRTIYTGQVDMEGIAAIPGGFAFASNYYGNILLADQSLIVTGSNDAIKEGIGLISARDFSWDSDTQEFISFAAEPTAPYELKLMGVSGNFGAIRTLVGFGESFPNYAHNTYLTDSQRIGIIRRTPAPISMDFYTNTGAPAGSVTLGSPTGAGVTFVADTGMIANNNGAASIRIFDPNTGTTTSFLDVSAAGMTVVRDISYANGSFYIPDVTSGRIFKFDPTGALLGSYDYLNSMHIVSPASLTYISNGPNAGSFAMVDSYDTTVTIFNLP